MEQTPEKDVTTLLREIKSGNPEASEKLFEKMREEFHRMATHAMANQPKHHTLQATALLHEAWIRIFDPSHIDRIEDREHLLCVAARAMRQILIDHSRRRAAGKRGGNWQRVPFDSVLDSFAEQQIDVHAIHEALEVLEALNPRQSTIVTLRVIGGFTSEEVADRLGIPPKSADVEYRVARAWLRKQLKGTA